MDEQTRLWVEHVRDVNARGECEFSGYPFRKCIESICDCGWEFLPDDQIDAEISKIVEGSTQ